MSAHDTDKEYATALGRCRQIFAAKLGDYGASWRIMRPEAITDQLFIRAKRKRTTSPPPAPSNFTTRSQPRPRH